MNTHEHLNKAR